MAALVVMAQLTQAAAAGVLVQIAVQLAATAVLELSFLDGCQVLEQ
jgi:hypothetical protein